MKRLFFLITLIMFSSQCDAQILDIVRGAKALKESKNQYDKIKSKVRHSDKQQPTTYQVDTTSAEYKNALQQIYSRNPDLKKIMESNGDTTEIKNYINSKYGGMSPEEIWKKRSMPTQSEVKRAMLEMLKVA